MPKETDWYPGIVQIAHQFGWRVSHSRAAINRSGKWSTPIMGDKGYPDFTFVHRDRGLFMIREIKERRTTTSPEQVEWLDSLVTAGIDAKIWRMPADWEHAVEELSFGRATPSMFARRP